MNSFQEEYKTSQVATRRFFAAAILGAGVVVSVQPAAALTVDATVLGTSSPWDPDPTINPALPYPTDAYGSGSGSGQTVVTGGLDFSAGTMITIAYDSGMISVGGSYGNTGPAGYSVTFPPSSPPSGNFPSDYTSGPYNLGELIGAFATSTGVVVGSPFVVGTGGSFVAPSGASELLLGINDDDFGNNTGFFDVSVSEVPLPASAPMFGAALLALGVVGYGLKRKKAKATA